MSSPVALWDTKSIGHCHPPMDTFPPINILYNYFIRVNGLPIITKECVYIVHACHNDFRMFPEITTGSINVRINGNPIARSGDSIDCGDTVGQSQTFFRSS